VLVLLGSASSALAVIVTFRHTSGAIIDFSRTETSRWVGQNQQNRRLQVSIIQASHNTISGFTPSLTIDGVFGNNTHNGIVRFQARYRITTDGIAGSNTWNHIHNERGAASYAPGINFLVN